MSNKATSILSIALVANGIMFILYERYLLQTKYSWIYYLTMISISLLFSILAFNLQSNSWRLSYILAVIILMYATLKFGFISSIPSSVLTIYIDAHTEYQVANSLRLGHLQHISYYTHNAQSLSTMPVVPIFSYMLHKVSGFSLAILLKYLGAGITSVMIPLSYGILLQTLKTTKNPSSWSIAVLVVILSPWLLGFLVWGHYAIFSTVFVALFLWGILKSVDGYTNPTLVVIYLVIIGAFAFTHMYLLISFLFVYTLYVSILLISSNKDQSKNIIYMYVIYFAISIAYLVYLSNQFTALISMIDYLKLTMEMGSPSTGISYYATPKASPPYVVLLKYLGAVSIVILSSISIIWYHLKSQVELRKYMLFFSIGAIGALLVLPYFLNPSHVPGTDLFNRLFYFGLLSVSPYVAFYINTHRIPNYKHFLAGLLTLALLFGLLNATRPDIVDWNTPIVTGTDIRLHLTEWTAAGKFGIHIPDKRVYGVQAGVGPVGIFMRKRYIPLGTSVVRHEPLIPPGEFDKIPEILRHKYIFLRLSIKDHPDPGLIVNQGSLNKIRADSTNNIVYTASDVFVIKT